MLGLWLQLERLVVQVVYKFAIRLLDAVLWSLADWASGCLWEDIVLGIEEDIECREHILLIDNGLDGLPAALAHFAAVDFGEVFLLAAAVVGVGHGHVALQQGLEDALKHPLCERTRRGTRQSAEEWLQQGADLVERDPVFVNLAELGDEDVADLQCDALCAELVHEEFLKQPLEPLHRAMLVARRLQVAEHLGEHVPQQGQELVDAEVVNLVPVLVEDVEACLEPLLLALACLDALHELADL